MKINDQDFIFLAKIIKDKSGICLTKDKAYLIETRLLPVIRKHSINDFTALCSMLQMAPNKLIEEEIIEAMTTNETSFFRDLKPFEYLINDVLPHVIQNSKSAKIRIWSGACSSGQEAYSTCIKLLENQAKMGGKAFEIIATDIDNIILEKARKAAYTQFDVQRGLPITMLVKYFTQQGESWLLKDNIKSLVKFERLNLLDANYLGVLKDKFDIVFCRNVLIYFDEETKIAVLTKIAKLMHPHSVLFLGSAENPTAYCKILKPYKDINGLFCLA